MTATTERLIHVEKGNLGAEELAALTAVLITYASRANSSESRPRLIAAWRRIERESAFSGARSWCLAV